MGWLTSHWSELVALVTGGAAVVSDVKRRKAKREADQLKSELEAIRKMAGSLAPWEKR